MKHLSLIIVLLLLEALAPAAVNADQHWGDFRSEQCTRSGSGLRQFSAILWDIPWGRSWEDACAHMPADINGNHFKAPSRCVKDNLFGLGLNMWGQFDVPDPRCGTDAICNSARCRNHHGQCCFPPKGDQQGCVVCP